MREEINIMINNTANAPNNADTTSKILPKAKPGKRKLTPKKEPLSTTKATPKLAPEEIPNTEGPASGLLKRVCNNKPESPKAIPTVRAVIA